MQIIGLNLDNEKPLVSYIKYISYRSAKWENIKNTDNVNVIKNKVSAKKMGKSKNESMEVKNETRGLNIVIAKSLNVFDKDLRDVEDLKNAFIIAKKDYKNNENDVKIKNNYNNNKESIF